MYVRPPPALVERVRRYLLDVGDAAASASLGLTDRTVLRLGCGLQCQSSTCDSVDRRLAEIEASATT